MLQYLHNISLQDKNGRLHDTILAQSLPVQDSDPKTQAHRTPD